MKEDKTPQWEKELQEKIPSLFNAYLMSLNVSNTYGKGTESLETGELVKAFIKSTLEEVIEKIHECCDGECYHDDCCGKLSCVKAQLRKEFL